MTASTSMNLVTWLQLNGAYQFSTAAENTGRCRWSAWTLVKEPNEPQTWLTRPEMDFVHRAWGNGLMYPGKRLVTCWRLPDVRDFDARVTEITHVVEKQYFVDEQPGLKNFVLASPAQDWEYPLTDNKSSSISLAISLRWYYYANKT